MAVIEAKAATVGKTGKRKLAIVVVVVALLAVGGALGARRLAHSRQPKAGAATRAPVPLAVMHLESFVVNLADGAGQSVYLRVGIDLGVTKPSGAAEPSAGKEDGQTARVRDTILTVLMRLSAQDVSSAEGKSRLKQELLRALQQRLPELGITEVYYTDFLLQS